MAQLMKHLKTSLESRHECNDNNRQQPQIYTKNSMDRFGDDLCALLLSYLSLEDRFQYECVSKQFQRTVFGSVVDIDINDKLINKTTQQKATIKQLFSRIATKCVNIQTIDCRGMSKMCESLLPEVLTAFWDNSKNLDEIYCNLYENLDQLFDSIGTTLSQIYYISSPENQWFIHCHQLSRLRVHSIADAFVMISGQLMAKNLDKFYLNDYSSDDQNLLSNFVAHNQCLTSVNVIICNDESIYKLTAQLSRLTQLRRLSLGFDVIDANLLAQSLRTISKHCQRVQRLTLKIHNLNIAAYNNSRYTMISLANYQRLKRLQLTLDRNVEPDFWEPLKLCLRSTHLTLRRHTYEWEMDDHFLDNCDKHWPRLQYLSISYYHMTRRCLSHISRLPALQTLSIQCHRIEYGVCNLLSRIRRLKNIDINEKRFYCLKNDMTQQMKHLTSLNAMDDNKPQPQLYALNSMDRFGDDLFGLILTYLSLEDRFRCECVSKQFQRIVFDSVVDITLTEQLLKVQNQYTGKICAEIAVKCPNIRTVDCREISATNRRHIPKVLETFRENCRNLREIYCKFWTNSKQLVDGFGQLVTQISLSSIKSNKLLLHCPRASHLRVNSLADIFDTTSGQLLAKNLKQFHFTYNPSDNQQLLYTFVAENKCLQSLVVNDWKSNLLKNVTEFAQQLSRLTQLRDLTLNLKHDIALHSAYLRSIGMNCKQLVQLSLVLKARSKVMVNQTLDSLRFFPRLKRLQLTISVAIYGYPIGPLSQCKALTHLTLYLKQWLYKTNLLNNCDHVRYLYVYIRKYKLSKQLLDDISRLPALQMLVIEGVGSHDLSDNDFCHLLSRSPKLKSIEIRVNNKKWFYC